MKNITIRTWCAAGLLVASIGGMSVLIFVEPSHANASTSEMSTDPTGPQLVAALGDLGLDAQTLAALGIGAEQVATILGRVGTGWEDITAWRTAEQEVVTARMAYADAIAQIRTGTVRPEEEVLTAHDVTALENAVAQAEADARTRRVALRRSVLEGLATQDVIDRVACDDATCRVLPAPLRLAVSTQGHAARLQRALAVETSYEARELTVPAAAAQLLSAARAATGVPQAAAAVQANEALIQAALDNV